MRHRRRQWRVVGLLFALAATIGALALLGLAYALQSHEVEELQAQNETILSDHHAIGARFAEQSKRLAQQTKTLEEAIQSSYGRGFLAGREAERLPAGLRSLARYAAGGFLVPRRIPDALGERPPRVAQDLDGFTIRWQGAGFFASRSEPLSDWTRQALGGLRRLQVPPHRVVRLTGPSGVIYAWRIRGVTYAVIALPARKAAARAVIASAR